MCVCACACVCVHLHVRACARACARACVCVCKWLRLRLWLRTCVLRALCCVQSTTMACPCQLLCRTESARQHPVHHRSRSLWQVPLLRRTFLRGWPLTARHATTNTVTGQHAPQARNRRNSRPIRAGVKTRNLKKVGTHDILIFHWIYRCIKAGEILLPNMEEVTPSSVLCPFAPRRPTTGSHITHICTSLLPACIVGRRAALFSQLVHMTPQTRNRLRASVDEYGDDYTKPTKPQQLQVVFRNVSQVGSRT